MKQHVREPQVLEKKLLEFRKSGAKRLHVITDFDRTLTPTCIHGVSTSVSVGLLRRVGILGEQYTREAHELFDRFHPIEIDPKLTLEEKSGAMEEWWRLHLGILVQYAVSRKQLYSAIDKADIVLRDGTKKFLTRLAALHIPVLVFSSGLGDVIEEVLRREQLLTSQVHLIANFFLFDDEGKAIAVDNKQIIHVFNKKEVAIQDTPWGQNTLARKNVLLLGDSLGDAQMADGLEHDSVLKIGFLNEHIEQFREQYMQAFDVVLENCESLDPVMDLLETVVNEDETK